MQERDWKKKLQKEQGLNNPIFKKFFRPPGWLVVLLAAISAVSLTAIFINGWETHIFAYIMYVLVFYTLVLITIVCFATIPKKYYRMKQVVYRNTWGNRYMTDAAFKTNISLYRSLLIDLLYIVANTIWAVLYHTAWFGIFAFYHTILAGMRFLLLRYARHHEIGKKRTEELKLSRWCSVILLMLNLVLTAAVLMILYQDRGFAYPGILIYVMALYTFYSLTMAIVNLIRYRKYHSALLTMTKVINLAASLVSMLSLETAMLTQFGADTSPEVHWILIVSTGAGVAVIIMIMAVYTMVKANRELSRKNIK